MMWTASAVGRLDVALKRKYRRRRRRRRRIPWKFTFSVYNVHIRHFQAVNCVAQTLAFCVVCRCCIYVRTQVKDQLFVKYFHFFLLLLHFGEQSQFQVVGMFDWRRMNNFQSLLTLCMCVWITLDCWASANYCATIFRFRQFNIFLIPTIRTSLLVHYNTFDDGRTANDRRMCGKMECAF